jgi:vacuolar protein sorting-associated protein 13A/C
LTTPEEPSLVETESILSSPEDSDTESMQVTYSQRPSISSPRPSMSPGDPASETQPSSQSSINIAFRVNLVDAQVILIANPLSSNSEAIVLGIRQVLLSRQHALTFQISEIGMFLCRMDRFETSRLRIIDDFSVQLGMDSPDANSTDIHIEIEPLILRLSLRDILLALQIIGRAGELSGSDSKEPKESAADQKAKQLRSKAKYKRGDASTAKSNTIKTASTSATTRAVAQKPYSPPKNENLSATIDGIRIVLIGDLHELPILDIGIQKFTSVAENWSSNLKAEAAVDMYSNVYNFAKSSWEPLLEPWQVGLGVARDSVSGLLSVDVVSKKTFDVTVTTATIALASKSFDFLTGSENVLDKPRGVEAPYKIRNYTGFNAAIHSKSPTSSEPITLQLEDGQEAPWSFENWEKMRENILAESSQNDVVVHLEASGFDPVKNVCLNREGEFLYSLRPKTNNVLHKLCVEVSLGADNVKYVTLRSPLVVENATQIPVELGIYDAQDGHLLKIEKIAPGDSRPAPVGAVYEKRVLVRPDSGFGYQWSAEQLWWQDLLKRPTRQLVCKGESGDPFYFQAHASFDRSNPNTG